MHKSVKRMAKYKCGNTAIISDYIKYKSYGKDVTGLVMKIVDTDDKQLKVLPTYRGEHNTDLVAIKAHNCTLVKRNSK